MRRILAPVLDGGAIAVAVLVAAAALGHGVAALGGLRPIAIGGGSMAPTIAEGSLVFIGPIEEAEPLMGAVVVYRGGNGTIVTHRVIREASVASAAAVETRGDANEEPDPALVGRDALIGRVEISIPFAGHVVRFIGQPAGWAMLAGGVVAAWLAADLLRPAARRRPTRSDRWVAA